MKYLGTLIVKKELQFQVYEAEKSKQSLHFREFNLKSWLPVVN